MVGVHSGRICNVRYSNYQAHPPDTRVVVNSSANLDYSTHYSSDKKQVEITVWKYGRKPSGNQASAPAVVQPAVKQAIAPAIVRPAVNQAIVPAVVRPAVKQATAPAIVQPAVNQAIVPATVRPAVTRAVALPLVRPAELAVKIAPARQSDTPFPARVSGVIDRDLQASPEIRLASLEIDPAPGASAEMSASPSLLLK